MPQDETAIDQNPTRPTQLRRRRERLPPRLGHVGLLRDDGQRQHWYDGITPFPSLPSGDNLDGGGDPVIVFDRSGSRTTRRSTSTAPTTRAASGSTARRTAASRGRGRASRSRPTAADEQRVCGGPGDPAAGRRHGRLHPGQQQRPGRQRAGIRQGVADGRAAARRRHAAVLHADHAHARSTASRRSSASDRLYVTYSLFSEDGSARDLPQLLRRPGALVVAGEVHRRQRGVLRSGGRPATRAPTARARSRRSTRRPASSGWASSTVTRPTRTSTSS